MATREPEQIRSEIEETREQLGETVEALAEKADVKGQAKAKVEETKQRFTRKAGRREGADRRRLARSGQGRRVERRRPPQAAPAAVRGGRRIRGRARRSAALIARRKRSSALSGSSGRRRCESSALATTRRPRRRRSTPTVSRDLQVEPPDDRPAEQRAEDDRADEVHPGGRADVLVPQIRIVSRHGVRPTLTRRGARPDPAGLCRPAGPARSRR